MGCKEGPRITFALPTLTHIIKFAHRLAKRPKGLFLFQRVIGCEERIVDCWFWLRF